MSSRWTGRTTGSSSGTSPTRSQTAAGDGAGGFYTQTNSARRPSPVIQPTEFPQPIGTVRVYAMPGGKIGIIVDGSTPNTELTINPLPHPDPQGLRPQLRLRRSGAEPPAQRRPDHRQQRRDRRHRGLPLRRPVRTPHRHRHGDHRPDRVQLHPARGVDRHRRHA